jgi:hypothetical protein
MKKIPASVGILLGAFATIWPIVATRLSAANAISVSAETGTTLLCYPAAVVAPVLLWGSLKMNSSLRSVLTALTILVGMLVVLKERGSNNRFAELKIASLPAKRWSQLCTTLETMAKASLATNNPGISKYSIPAEFGFIGTREQCSGAFVITQDETNYAAVALVYGYRNRRWGLLVGPPENLGFYQKFKRIPLGPNDFFFIGRDW